MASKDSRHSIPSYPRVYLMLARQNLNLSAEEVSRQMDVSKSYYYSLENGSRGHKMTAAMIARIKECLMLDANEIIEEETKYQIEREVFMRSKRKKY